MQKTVGIGQGEMAVANVSRGRQRLLFAMENDMLNPTAGWGDKLHVGDKSGILHTKRRLRRIMEMRARSLYHFFFDDCVGVSYFNNKSR